MLAVGPKRWRTVRGAKQMISWVRAVGGRRDVVLVMRRGPEDMNLPGFRSRQVSRQLKELWEVSGCGGWRLNCRSEDGSPSDVGCVDHRHPGREAFPE